MTLRLANHDEPGLKLVAVAGSAVHASPPMPVLTNEETLAYTAFRKGKPIVTNNYSAEPEASPNITSLGMNSMVLIPINVGGITLGLVNVVSQKTGQFPPERVRLLTAIVDGMGGLIENARLDEERKRTEERMHETARLASIGELAAGVAHEVNNPLTSVLGYSEMVL